MRSDNVMEMSFAVFLLLTSFITSLSDAVNPGCECVVYSATYGKERGIFTSPDFPKPYPPDIDCLLYTFIAGPDEIIEIQFTDFDVYKSHQEYWKSYLGHPIYCIKDKSK